MTSTDWNAAMAAIGFSRMVSIILGHWLQANFHDLEPPALGTRFRPSRTGAERSRRCQRSSAQMRSSALAHISCLSLLARQQCASPIDLVGVDRWCRRTPRVAGMGEDRGELIVVQLPCERLHSRAGWLSALWDAAFDAGKVSFTDEGEALFHAELGEAERNLLRANAAPRLVGLINAKAPAESRASPAASGTLSRLGTASKPGSKWRRDFRSLTSRTRSRRPIPRHSGGEFVGCTRNESEQRSLVKRIASPVGDNAPATHAYNAVGHAKKFFEIR
jgi:hypothetical protein